MKNDHPITAAERELWDERIAMVLADHPDREVEAEETARRQLLANRKRNLEQRAIRDRRNSAR